MVENYKLWTIVEDDKEPNSSKEMIHSPLSHLKKNMKSSRAQYFLMECQSYTNFIMEG